jgi:hypothetical protein
MRAAFKRLFAAVSMGVFLTTSRRDRGGSDASPSTGRSPTKIEAKLPSGNAEP